MVDTEIPLGNFDSFPKPTLRQIIKSPLVWVIQLGLEKSLLPLLNFRYFRCF